MGTAQEIDGEHWKQALWILRSALFCGRVQLCPGSGRLIFPHGKLYGILKLEIDIDHH